MMNKVAEVFKRFFRSRSLKYGANSIILIIAVIAIVVVVNKLTDMAGLKLDLTPNKIYTMSGENKDILKTLDKDVTIYGLFDEASVSSAEYKEVMELLNQYSKFSHVSVKYVDPDKNPGTIREIDKDGLMGVAKGDFVVKSGNKVKKLTFSDLFYERQTEDGGSYKAASTAEQGITGAVKYVTSEKTPTVYFLQGHGEKQVDSDYTEVKSYLEKNNYDSKTLSLTTQKKVPEDAAILIVASPKKDLSTDERIKLEDYLKNNTGKLVLLFDSLETGSVFTEFETLLKTYNVAINYDKVKENDPDRHLPTSEYDLVTALEQNEINAAFGGQDFQMIMPTSRSISILKNEKGWLKVHPLMKTSDQAVGEPIDTSKSPVNGPLDLAVAAEISGGAKVLVMGNSMFMSDAAKESFGPYYVNGMYFFLNSLNWMQDKKEEVTITPKLYETETLKITATQANNVTVVVVFVLPLLILGSGTFVWLRRRHL
jgi:ABC-2 type transport system permease protein